jgi:heme/copper-type cytochrome/quinol oxidase subunit 1
MRILGLVFLIGGFLVRLASQLNPSMQSPTLSILAWILMVLGVVIVIISYLTKKK